MADVFLTVKTGALRVIDNATVRLIELRAEIFNRLRAYGYSSPTAYQSTRKKQ